MIAADSYPQSMARVVPGIIERGEAATAFNIVKRFPRHEAQWQPEAMMLLNTPGLSQEQTRRMVLALYPASGVLDDKAVAEIADCNARVGRIGFSFPQWRFLAQSFDGASLLERFGMTKLRRSTDIADAKLPDPQRDRLGTGYAWTDGTWTVEYRRSYILCSTNAPGDAATIVIRNNSFFYGRDRLPDAAYVSWTPMNAGILKDINENILTDATRFARWPSGQASVEKRRRVSNLLDYFDAFDTRLSQWLCENDKDGVAPLQYFMRAGQAGKPGAVPVIAGIDPSLPPWFPKVAAGKGEGLKDIFNRVQKAGAKLVLLTSADGDFPIQASTLAPPFAMKSNRL